MEDLSKCDHPIGDLFPRPTKPEDWEGYRLSDAQVAFFHENGYLPGVRIFNDDQIEALRKELEVLKVATTKPWMASPHMAAPSMRRAR